MVGFVFSIVIEIAVSLFLLWGWLLEDKFIAFEEKLLAAIKDAIRKKRRDICAKWLAKNGLVAVPIETEIKSAAIMKDGTK